MANYRKGPDYLVESNGCWIWQGATNNGGYGLITRNSKQKLAHIYFYEQKYGKVPKGKELDHICRNRNCVNPDHLEPVTRAINVRRGLLSKLSEEDVLLIRSLRNRISQRNLAKQFGVCHTTIGRIQRFEKWTELTDTMSSKLTEIRRED